MRLRDHLVARLPERNELLERVKRALMSDPRVSEVTVFGSLQDGKHDEFTDIDLAAHLRPGVADREFFLDVPRLLEQIGSAVPGWGFTALPDQYVATFIFDEYPLFWEVDVACVGNLHTDGSALIPIYRWEQIYKMWIGAAKYAARADWKAEQLRDVVGTHVPVEWVPHNSVERLRALLDAIKIRKASKADPYESLHERCEDLLSVLR